eukprot:scaffold285_cov304-Pinguiococcus_pyrenoidosus.AAC.32
MPPKVGETPGSSPVLSPDTGRSPVPPGSLVTRPELRISKPSMLKAPESGQVRFRVVRRVVAEELTPRRAAEKRVVEGSTCPGRPPEGSILSSGAFAARELLLEPEIWTQVVAIVGGKRQALDLRHEVSRVQALRAFRGRTARGHR